MYSPYESPYPFTTMTKAAGILRRLMACNFNDLMQLTHILVVYKANVMTYVISMNSDCLTDIHNKHLETTQKHLVSMWAGIISNICVRRVH